MEFLFTWNYLSHKQALNAFITIGLKTQKVLKKTLSIIFIKGKKIEGDAGRSNVNFLFFFFRMEEDDKLDLLFTNLTMDYPATQISELVR